MTTTTQDLKQDDVSMEEVSEKLSNQDIKPFMLKLDGKSKPIPNSVKKKRSNFRLRKVIVPKAPLMVLNEMVGSVNYTFLNTPPIPNSIGTAAVQLFTAQCVVDGQTFTGEEIYERYANEIPETPNLADVVKPDAANIIRLTFHDCLVDSETGGCNG